ncbi:MAG: type IV toxin-antitoxin system AbiEi family antitoxin [Elusimicrobia bacterium]|nr:type IV toxin-antitoxin system AbiEi family antitoxin [Elusimicrobiota bacterium]
MNKKNNNYRGLSKDEVYLISRAGYEKQKLITKEYVRALFGDKRKAVNVLYRLTKKGRLLQIERGKYIIVPLDAPNQLWSPNEFITAKLWMGDIPYYIGYFTMYNYWGFTEQVPNTIFVLNTKRSFLKTIGSIRYKAVKIENKKYYGIKKIKIDNEYVSVSDRERTLVDFLYYPISSFGSIKEVLESNISKIDRQKFIKYLIAFPVASVKKRAGYLLEKINFNKELLQKLKRSIDNDMTFVKLNPDNSNRRGKIDKNWRIIING